MNDSGPIGFDDIFQDTSTYIEELIAGEVFPFQMAEILNAEVPKKLEDTRRSLVAVLEEHLANRGEVATAKLNSQLRIRYYEEQVESKLSAKFQMIEWAPWAPTLSEYTRKAGAILTGGFGIAAVLAAYKVAGFKSLKIPVYDSYPIATPLIFVTLAFLSSFTTTHPEIIPSVLIRERIRANAHTATYLRNVKGKFLTYVREAENALDGYVGSLEGGSVTST
jgi:hypothetical protein